MMPPLGRPITLPGDEPHGHDVLAPARIATHKRVASARGGLTVPEPADRTCAVRAGDTELKAVHHFRMSARHTLILTQVRSLGQYLGMSTAEMAVETLEYSREELRRNMERAGSAIDGALLAGDHEAAERHAEAWAVWARLWNESFELGRPVLPRRNRKESE